MTVTPVDERLNTYTTLMSNKREIEHAVFNAKVELVKILADNQMYDCLTVNVGRVHQIQRKMR